MPSTKYETKSSTRESVFVFFEATAGVAGAVPATFTRSRDVVSVVKASTTWTFTLDGGASALLGLSGNIINAAYVAATSAVKAEILSETVNGSAKQVVVQFRKNDGTPVDLAVGDVLKLRFALKKSAGLA